MGKKNRKGQVAKPKSNKRPAGISIKQRLKEYLASKNPILLFVLGFSVLIGMFYVFWMTNFFKENVFYPVLNINAAIASFILNVFGFGTIVSGKVISNSEFSISVARGCDAIEPVALFVAAVISFPASFKKKLRGIGVGIVFLLGVNMLRILSLFLTGVYAPAAFDIMHMEVWQVVFIVLAILCWLLWIQWALRPDKKLEK